MPQPSIHLFGKSWDTSFARKFLQIPEEQLKMINSISGWPAASSISATNEVPFQLCVDKGEQMKNMGSAQSEQRENTGKLTQLKSPKESIKNCEEIKNRSQSKENVHNLRVKKQALSRSASLSILTQSGDPRDQLKLRSSNSSPNICQSHIYYKHLEPIEPDVETAKVFKVITDTAVVSTAMYIEESPFKNQNDKISSNTIKLDLKLGDQVVNHKFFKTSKNPAATSSDNEILFENIATLDRNNHNPLLDRRLMLLEKRFSPSKEVCVFQPEDDNPTQSETNSSSKSKGPSSVKNDILTSSQDVNDNSLKSKIVKEVQKSSILQVAESQIKRHLNIRPDDLHILSASQSSKNGKDLTLEDTFGLKSIPSGQPLPQVERPLFETNLLNKANDETATTCDKMPVNVSEQIHSSVAISDHEKTKAEHLTLGVTQRVTTKRKRKSKDDVCKKQRYSKDSREINIQYTNDQLRNMIDLIKMFHSEY